MAPTTELDACILPYIHNNDPLPENLKPILDIQLEKLRTVISACDVRISQEEDRISECQRKIQALNENISSFQAEVECQVETKTRHGDMIRTLNGTVSVVRRLPPETIAAIFTWSPQGFRILQKEPIIHLSAVSKQWRNTALTTPCLWRKIYVDVGHFAKGRSPEQARSLFSNTLNLWLSRGGKGAKLDVSFDCRDMITADSSLQAWDVVNWIHTSSLNFGALAFYDVFFSSPELQTLFSTTITGSLQSTRQLYVVLRALPLALASHQSQSVNLELGMPHLDEFRISASSSAHLPRRPSPLIHQGLTKLILEDFILSPSCFSIALKGLPALQFLSLYHCCPVPNLDSAEENRPFVHGSIRVVCLTIGLHEQLLSHLVCPALKRLELNRAPAVRESWAGGVGDESARALGEFIHRSQAPAITLRIGGQFPNIFLNALLSASSPRVKTLDVKSYTCFSSFHGRKLVLPRSIECVRSPGIVSEDEVATWISKLAMCLEDPSNQTLRVKMGEGDSAHVRHIGLGRSS
ncbi:hypothetical protein BKA70DRAFT_1562358 [Coprinopsis sp. MPI-PUGE-AT-0042]|nr:hypothetical protein BKA70DRAFT_1562358 [Coprinopsis sp. MPI-PUGE-AT-0042]